jgi:diaminohydroxyphosphoribosylaminopyrimidine deaminase/5-amino-6-(5-phosphoribosylamino)uracil reductase
MRAALALAARGLGGTWPNPSVGCVIVGPDGRVVGRGRTATGGRPHAETMALAMAAGAAGGATAYVTLEPCSHHGQTPPCADALIAAGVARVVVAAGDPDPRVNGAGLARLRAAGINVEVGFLESEAAETLAGFCQRVQGGRPLVTLKLASTLDGRIATAAGESRWITGPQARRAVQELRARHDAVMVGVGTVLADDPDLTCRLAGAAHRPTVRLVADSRQRTPPQARLILGARESPSWILHLPTDDGPRGALEAAGARCIEVAAGDGGIDLHAALQALGSLGLTRILVEGGAALAASLLRHDLVDRLVWFHAPAVMGADGLAAVGELGTPCLSALRRFVKLPGSHLPTGDDTMTELRKAG